VVLVSLFLAAGTGMWVLFAMAGMLVLYMAVIIVIRPYSGYFANIVVVFYELTVLYAMALAFLNNFAQIEEEN
jgi:glucan phosphoethanolaminetransferase (alkaline phosphatase superfamily)